MLKNRSFLNTHIPNFMNKEITGNTFAKFLQTFFSANVCVSDFYKTYEP